LVRGLPCSTPPATAGVTLPGASGGDRARRGQARPLAGHPTFAALVDEVRAELARMYLADPRLAIFEVAYLLGFSEASAFHRAFRRWTGTSPSEHRRPK
jgi:AraC-like DNA-binding protein